MSITSSAPDNMFDATTQWLPFTLKICTYPGPPGLLHWNLCCRTVSYRPPIWGNCCCRYFEARVMCVSLSQPCPFNRLASAAVGQMRCAFGQLLRSWSTAARIINWLPAQRVWSNARIDQTRATLQRSCCDFRLTSTMQNKNVHAPTNPTASNPLIFVLHSMNCKA